MDDLVFSRNGLLLYSVFDMNENLVEVLEACEISNRCIETLKGSAGTRAAKAKNGKTLVTNGALPVG